MSAQFYLPELLWLALPSANGVGLVLAGLAFLVWHYRDHAIGTRSRPDLAQDRGWPLIGNMKDVIGGSRQLEHDLRALLEHGPVFTRTVPGLRVIAIQKLEYIEHVQSNKGRFDNYIKGSMQIPAMIDVLGTGIFASDGHQWLSQRKAAAHIFSRNSFRGVIQTNVQEHTKILLEVIRKHADENTAFAFNELMLQFTLDTFVAMSFHQELNSMRNGTVPFAVAFDHAQERINTRVMQPGLWQIIELFSQAGRDQRKAIKILDEYCYDVIDKRAEKLAAGKVNEADLLSLFAEVRDESGEPLSRKQLRDAVLNLIIAGRDTTAQALAWCFFYLVSDWDRYATPIREEAAKVLGSEVMPTYDNYKQLVKANAVFHEALRLHPSVAKNGKVALEDDQIPNGPFVHKGDIVYWSDYGMARDPNGFWGSDAVEFKPFSRWIDEEGKLKRFTQWQFHAFNGGPRLCLGQNLATYEAVSVIVALVLTFDLKFKSGYLETSPMTEGIVNCGKAPRPVFSLTLPMADPMQVIACPRSSSL